ncbi:hypothetical protein D3C71_1786520 [compost metagenome]
MPAIIRTCAGKRFNRISLTVALIITKGNVGLLPWGYLDEIKVRHIGPRLQGKLGLRFLIGGKGAKAGVLAGKATI